MRSLVDSLMLSSNKGDYHLPKRVREKHRNGRKEVEEKRNQLVNLKSSNVSFLMRKF